MKLLYTITVPANGSVELIIPIGVKSCKMRAGSNVLVEGVNVTPDIKFPIIAGKSPCKFEISQISGAAVSTTFYVLITEIGGIPNPDYFEALL